MSRGLSKQQRSILGLAYSVRCAFNGGQFVEYPEPVLPPDDKFRVTYVLTKADRLPDYQMAIGLHYLAELPFSNGRVTRHTKYGTVTQDNPGVFAHTKESRCVKASLSRAANTLNRQGYLAWQEGEKWYGYGYILTAKAYGIGKDHQVEVCNEDAIALLLDLNIHVERFERHWQYKTFQKFVAAAQESQP